MTLTAYARFWLDDAKTTKRARRAFFDTRLPYLELHILPALGALPVGQIDEPTLSAWRRKLASARKADGEPFAQTTLASIWSLLRMMLRDAKSLIGVRVDAAWSFRWRVVGVPPRRKERLTAEETYLLLAHALAQGDVRWAAQVWMHALLGARHSEVSALRMGRVDLDAGVVHIEASQVQGEFNLPKTKGSMRKLPIGPQLLALLSEHIKRLGELGLPTGKEALLFPSEVGKPRFVSVTNAKLQELVDGAGIEKHITSHSFRHAMNNFVRRTGGEVAARGLLGHVTDEMTYRYGEVDLAEKRDVVARIFGGLPTPQFGLSAPRPLEVGTSGGDHSMSGDVE